MEQVIWYRRCSSKKQGEKFSLQRQADYLNKFCNGRFEVIGDYSEVASGALPVAERPQLMAALAHAAKAGCTVLVMSISRLSRDVELIAGFMNKHVRFKVAECFEAGPFEIQLRSIFAEEERRKIVQRVKHGLATAKANGVKLGNPRLHEVRAQGVEAVQRNADEFAEGLRHVIQQLRDAGLTSATSMSNALNARGIMTARSKRWYPQTVINLLSRLDALQAAES